MTPGTIYRKSDGREREFLRAYRDVRTCTDLVVARFTEPGRAPEVRTVTAQGWALIIAGCEVIAPACADPGAPL